MTVSPELKLSENGSFPPIPPETHNDAFYEGDDSANKRHRAVQRALASEGLLGRVPTASVILTEDEAGKLVEVVIGDQND